MAEVINTVAELEERLSRPVPQVIDAMATLPGDLMILGAGGKMGPSLAEMAARAIDAGGVKKRVFGVSRFSDRVVKKKLDALRVETIEADLLDEDSLRQLPDVENVIYMVGRKFGSTGNEPLTWMVNTMLPGEVIRRFRNSRVVVFSTGNVYPLMPVESSGARESTPPAPVGEYSQSCLGRERIVEYWSERLDVAAAILRLNYAIDLRYGVLLDIASRVRSGEPVDLGMGYVNVIWQGDANAAALLALTAVSKPPQILNVTGMEKISVRSVAEEFGRLLDVEPVFANAESETALLSDAGLFHELFSFPKVTVDQMVQWIVHWIKIGGPVLNKPTMFEQREGRF